MTFPTVIAYAGMSCSFTSLVNCSCGAPQTNSSCRLDRAMACILLLFLHLIYTSLATVQTSIMPHSSDGSIFVEQHPYLHQNPNSSCEDYVTHQARIFAEMEFKGITSTVKSVSKMFVGNVLHSSKEIPTLEDNIHTVTSLMDLYASFVKDQDARILEITFTVRLNDVSGSRNKEPVILLLKMEHFNMTWQTQRNWERVCQLNSSSLTGINFETTVKCSTKTQETLLINANVPQLVRTGNDRDHNSRAQTSSGFWNVYCSPQTRTVDSVLFIYDVLDEEVQQPNKSIPEQLRGSIAVRLEVNNGSFNQCAIGENSGLPLSLKHKCRSTTKCVHIPTNEKGFVLGSYKCVCSEGTTYPSDITDNNNTTRFFTGLIMEKMYYNYLIGTDLTYETSFQCHQCDKVCSWPLCLDHISCAMHYGLLYRLPILIITTIALLGVIVLMGMVCKYRNEKIMKASSPGLLLITLLGSLLLYSEIIVTSCSVSNFRCMLQPWMRHIGFSLAYGGLLFKTWRISVIMRVFKSRAFKTRNSELYKKLTFLTTLWVIYLTLWTVVEPVRPVSAFGDGVLCSLTAWDFVGYGGEMILLVWGASLCYQARKAPHLYNETRQVSYALWNEGIWEIFLALSRFLLHGNPDPNMILLVQFLRTMLTVTPMLILIFMSKFLIMFRKVRQVHGTLTDVYGSKRVHRLSLMVNKQGEIKTIYCTPCGPLAYLNQSEESDSTSREPNKQNVKEDEYSKAEVDSLIELVSRLKSERALYKIQVKRLLQLLHSSKHRPNGLSPSLVAEDPDGCNSQVLDLATGDISYPECPPNDVSEEDFEKTRYFQCSTSAGPRSSHASTVTTLVSSSTPDDTSLTESRLDCPLPSAETTVLPHSLEPCGESSPCKNCHKSSGSSSTNSISRYALTVLTRKLAQNHVIGKTVPLEPDIEDFPQVLYSHDETCNNNQLYMKDYIPTVYGNFCDTLLSQQNRELQEMVPTTAGVHRRTSSSASSESVGLRPIRDSSEKLNFIMYI